MTLMEDLAFRRMLDLFYESEKPLPFELKRIAKLIGMNEHQEEIRDVLNEFWDETENGWVNSRAKDEIDKYQAKADTARVNGKKGGRPKTQQEPRITQSVNLANPEITGLKANHKPLTINQELIKENTSLKNDGFEHWWKLYPKKVGKKKAETKFKRLTKKMNEDDFLGFIDLISLDTNKRFAEKEQQFILHPTTYLNEERWNDE